MCSTLSLSCPLCCLSSFPDIDSFKLNLIKVNSKPIHCPLCDDVLLGLDKLTIHLFGHSLPTDMKWEKPMEIQQKIKKEPKQKQRNKVMKISTNTITTTSQSDANYKCEICGFVFVDENLLNLHLSLVHNFMPSSEVQSTEKIESNEKFNCHLCKKSFKMKGALRIHIRVAHLRFHDQNQKQINIADYLKSQKTITQCTLKTEMLSLQEPRSPNDAIYQASITSSPVSYLAPSPQYSSGGEQKETKSKSSSEKPAKTFECEECKKKFTTKYFLKKHARLHSGEQPYKCEKCDKMFHFQQSYHKHLLYHSDEKPYECTECGRAFKELSTLHNHERIHSGVKPYGCQICGKFFRQRVSYLVHQRIHNGILPYKCSECGKGFRYKVSQRSHKCSGTLIKQPGELIQKLMQNSSILPSSTVVTNETINTNNHISIENHLEMEHIEHEQQQNQHHVLEHEANGDLCLDDLLKESYDKLLKSNGDDNLHHLLIPQSSHCTQSSSSDAFDTINISPFNDMALNSNYGGGLSTNQMNFTYHQTTLETINEESIKELLYGTVG